VTKGSQRVAEVLSSDRAGGASLIAQDVDYVTEHLVLCVVGRTRHQLRNDDSRLRGQEGADLCVYCGDRRLQRVIRRREPMGRVGHIVYNAILARQVGVRTGSSIRLAGRHEPLRLKPRIPRSRARMAASACVLLKFQRSACRTWNRSPRRRSRDRSSARRLSGLCRDLCHTLLG
jgi:hypothetical protein